MFRQTEVKPSLMVEQDIDYGGIYPPHYRQFIFKEMQKYQANISVTQPDTSIVQVSIEYITVYVPVQQCRALVSGHEEWDFLTQVSIPLLFA